VLSKGAKGIEEDIERKGARLERMLLELVVYCMGEELVGVAMLVSCEWLVGMAMLVCCERLVGMAMLVSCERLLAS
jgi:hypothetical protein